MDPFLWLLGSFLTSDLVPSQREHARPLRVVSGHRLTDRTGAESNQTLKTPFNRWVRHLYVRRHQLRRHTTHPFFAGLASSSRACRLACSARQWTASASRFPGRGSPAFSSTSTSRLLALVEIPFAQNGPYTASIPAGPNTLQTQTKNASTSAHPTICNV